MIEELILFLLAFFDVVLVIWHINKFRELNDKIDYLCCALTQLDERPEVKVRKKKK